jgi:hypothetical protein
MKDIEKYKRNDPERLAQLSKNNIGLIINLNYLNQLLYR